MTIKIAFLKSNLSHRGGLEKYTLRMAEAFAKRGCQVQILTTGWPEGASLPRSDIEAINLCRRGCLSLSNIYHFDRQCLDWLKHHPVDIVFGLDRNSFQTHYRAGNGVHAEYLAKRAFIDSPLKRLSFFINPLHRYILRLERQTFEHPQLRTLFTNSEMVRGDVLRHYHTAPEKIHVIHNGVEWNELQGTFNQWGEQRPLSQKQLGLDSSCHQFLFIGNGYQRKGLGYLLEGLSHLSDKNFQLSVVGKEKNIKFYVQLAEKFRLQSKVKFFGPQSDMKPFFQSADSLVIPSLYDPFANVTLEGLAMGLFVISSPFNGGHEVLTNENGVTMESLFDRDVMIHCLQEALKRPKTPHSALSIRNSVQHLDFPNQLNKLVDKTLETR